MLILGAGLAGMTAALELHKAGYRVQVLECNRRPGGRNWTLRGGDTFTELGGFTQTCEFEQGLYFNPGPWRIPYHHRAVLDYCKRLNVALEPFIQLNHNALLHASSAFDGRPQRIRDIKADFQGQVSELLAKATEQGRLDEAVSSEDRESRSSQPVGVEQGPCRCSMTDASCSRSSQPVGVEQGPCRCSMTDPSKGPCRCSMTDPASATQE